jgi:hypothetical protein
MDPQVQTEAADNGVVHPTNATDNNHNDDLEDPSSNHQDQNSDSDLPIQQNNDNNVDLKADVESTSNDQHNSSTDKLENSDLKAEAESSSDESSVILDKNQAIDMFNKMTKESIDKIMQSDSSDENDASDHQDIDKMINSNPQALILENGNGQQQPQIEVTADASEDQPEIQKEGDLTENIVETEALPEQPPQQEPLSNDDTKIDEEPEQTTRTQQQPQEEKLLSEQEFNRGNKVSDQEQPTQQKQVLKDGDILIDPTAPLDNTQENEDEDDDLLPNNSSSDADRQSEFKDQIKRLLMQGKALANDEDYDNKKGYAYDDEHEEGEYDIENEEEPSKREQLGRFLEQYNNEKAKKHDIAKDGPATELSNDILSYERFFPGRILGNTFTVINKTKEKISMKLNFTANGIDKDYMSKKLMEFYEVSNVEEVEHPYLNYLQQPIIDVQKEFE